MIDTSKACKLTIDKEDWKDTFSHKAFQFFSQNPRFFVESVESEKYPGSRNYSVTLPCGAKCGLNYFEIENVSDTEGLPLFSS